MCLTTSSNFEDLNVTECAKRSFDSAKVVTEQASMYNWDDVMICYESNFNNTANKQESLVESLGKQYRSNPLLSSFEVIPALVIEDYLVRGNMDPMSLASSICDSLIKPPSAVCNNLPEIIDEANRIAVDPYTRLVNVPPQTSEYLEEFSFIRGLVIMSVLVGSFVLIVGCAYLAKKLMDRNLYRHLNTEVEQNVQAYIRMRNEETTGKPGHPAIDV